MSRIAGKAEAVGHKQPSDRSGGAIARSRARGLLAAVLGATLVAWIVLARSMRGMDAGPTPISARSAGTSASG